MRRYDLFLFGFAVGAATAWLMDPDRGRRRRKLVRDQIVHAGHELEDTARAKAKHLTNRAAGLVHEARGEILDPPVDDRVLEERVRSAVGRVLTNPGALIVSADRGVVVLSGEVSSAEVQKLVQAARSVRGVEQLENLLQARTDASGTRGLQGSGRA
jgi:uncharacterized protein YunC (DUF1805 family)